MRSCCKSTDRNLHCMHSSEDHATKVRGMQAEYVIQFTFILAW